MKKHILIFLTILFATINSYAIEIIHGPYLQNVTSTEATIVWISDSLSIGWVELAPDDNSSYYAAERPQFFDGKNGIKAESRIHTVHLTGLKPGTSYRYRAYAREVLSHKTRVVLYGDVAATQQYDVLHFKTLSDKAESVSFSMVNDIHGDREKLAKLISYTDIPITDMVLFVGDMVSYFEDENNVFNGFMDEAVKLFASTIPMFYTRGNHETRGKLAYNFQDYFSPGSEHIYYMFRHGPVCFVALDCGEDKPDSDIEYYGLTMYDQYRDQQAQWLEKVLQSQEYQNAPFKIITCHMPPRESWHGENEILHKFAPIIEKYGADIMLCGHLHKYINYPAGKLVQFPVIVNSNTSVIRSTVNSHNLKIEVVDMDGKIIDRIEINK